jgi:predicted secreted protein
MDWFAIALTYAVSWWLVLFMVLPMGIKAPESSLPQEYGAAPINPNIRRKLLLTSILTLIPTALFHGALYFGLLDGVL